MSRFLSERFNALAPYAPGEQPRIAGLIKLNTNESPFPPSPGVLDALNRESVAQLNLYSDPALNDLKAALAKRFNAGVENVFAGNGSDEVLALAMYGFGGRGFAFPDLTYGFYPVWARLFGLDYVEIPLDAQLRVNPRDYANLNRAIVIANPNAPTGLCLALDDIEYMLKANRDCAFIVDEAYVEFGGESARALLPKYEQLLIVGTFSKAWNLAGARIGYAVGNAELIADLERLRMSFHPYNINRLSLIAGARALYDEDYYADCRARVMRTRERVSACLCEMGFVATDSRANFIFARPPRFSAREWYEALRKRGILVRHLGGRASEYLRITVGSDAQMDALTDACREIIADNGAP